MLIVFLHGNFQAEVIYPGKILATDSETHGGDYWYDLIHELGHSFGFTKHYDDTWTVLTNEINQETYYSPFRGDVMDGQTPLRFSEYVKEIINRSGRLAGDGPDLVDEIFKAEISVVDKKGDPWSGKLTFFPGKWLGEHSPPSVEKDFFVGPLQIRGSFSYKDVGSYYIALVKAEDKRGDVSYTWLDSAVMQLTVFNQGQATLEIQ